VHVPLLQKVPLTQSALLVHVDLHVVPPHL
jgi:hypothetical protein